MDDLAAEIKAGKMDFDVVIASPDAMRVVGTLGQVLGPRGLMPNPKVGTVTEDIEKAVGETKSGKVYGYRFRGQRYDCGSKSGFLQATVAFGLARPDLRDEFSAYLHDMMALQKAAQ
jgi:hypothetical protein